MVLDKVVIKKLFDASGKLLIIGKETKDETNKSVP